MTQNSSIYLKFEDVYVTHLWKDALIIDAGEIYMAAFDQEIKICVHFVKQKRVSPILHHTCRILIFISEGYSI